MSIPSSSFNSRIRRLRAFRRVRPCHPETPTTRRGICPAAVGRGGRGHRVDQGDGRDEKGFHSAPSGVGAPGALPPDPRDI